ncbi:MAG TPA: FMN-binding negative transcriptional regulator [Chitinophagales bacterium]|nr:FMN-binding negative transcriptional regulator [Chitinophagales bacterium]
MYHFSYFKEHDQQVIRQFLTDHPFAFVTGSFTNGTQVATQIPMLFEERDGELFVQGHIMRNTDHHKALKENPHALIVFTGPSAYVSASWYSNPHMGSTYNYMSVHLAGKMQFMSPEALVDWMRRFTLQYEQGNTASPTVYDNLGDAYTNKMMPGIVGIEMRVEKMDTVFKLSQNRDEESYVNIIEQLKKRGGNSALIAEEMEKRKGSLYFEG